MPIQVTCPGCGRVYAAPDDWSGKTVRCTHCETQYLIPAGDTALAHEPVDADDQPSVENETVPEVAPDVYDILGKGETPSHVEPSERTSRSGTLLGTMDQVFEGMGQALSVRKLSFFLFSAIGAFVVWALLIRIGFAIGTGTGLGTMFIANAVAIGLSGVIAGGVAYLTVEEGRGQACRMADVLRFYRQRLSALFFGAILLAMGVGLVGGMVNGLIALLNQSRTVGSFVGSVLFVPQVLVNAALVVLCLVGVLVPCAVVVERIGPVRAIHRLVSLLIQRPGRLLLQFGITLYFGAMMLLVLAVLAAVSLGPTLATNGPSMAKWMPSLPSMDAGQADLSELFSSEAFEGLGLPGMEAGQLPSNLRPEPAAPRGHWGDWLRELGIGIVVIAVLAFPVVFWICAFARYYESLAPTFPAPVPDTKTPPTPPPLPMTGADDG